MHQIMHHSHPDGTPFPPEDCTIAASLAKGEGIHSDQEVFWRADGTGFPAEYWAFPIRKEGEVVGAVVTFLDITERKLAEIEKARLTSILEATTDFVALADLSGKILYLNRGGRKVLGFGEDEDLSDRINMDYHPAWAAHLVLNEGIPTALRNGTWSGETVLINHEGREIPISAGNSVPQSARWDSSVPLHDYARHHRTQAYRSAISEGQGGRRSRQPRQERIPGQHEPRNPHADERHYRHDGSGARYRAHAPSSGSISAW